MRFLILALATTSLVAPRASAQNCCGGSGSGPRCGNSASGCLAGLLGIKQYPLSDARYIRQFCGPHIAPGSCFGYFKPQITAWGEACPYYGDARVDAANSGLHKYNTPPAAGTTATLPTSLPETTPVPPKATVPVPEVPEAPMPRTPDSAIPPKPPSAPIVPTIPKL
jgi:hypothetical protein